MLKFTPVILTNSLTKIARFPQWSGGMGLFVLAFVIRLVYAAQFSFPPLDDPAYYIQTARSFFTPHPWQVSIIWNFQPRFATLLHPALDYWQPLPALVIALSFWLFGQNLLAAQLPSILAGALLPVFTFGLGRQVFAKLTNVSSDTAGWLGLAAGFYLAINPLLVYQSAAPDSSMLYAALVAGALLGWERERSRWQAVSLGLLIGLAYLTRTPAIFFILTGAMWLVWQRNWRDSLWVGLGVALPIGLWSLRNWLTFGFVVSPAGLQTIFIFNYQSLFNYQNLPNFSSFGAGGLVQIVKVRWEALANAWFDVLNSLFFPTVGPALWGLFLLLRQTRVGLGLGALYSLGLFVGLPLIFGVASTNGSYYHSVGSSAPVLAIGLIYSGWWLAAWVKRHGWLQVSLLPALALLLIILTLLKFGASYQAAYAVQQNEGETYRQIGVWLSQHPATSVITNEPSSLNYATGVPTVRLPAAENLDILAQVAAFYHANYIIVTENTGLYPYLLQNAAQNKHFQLVFRAPNDAFEIYSVLL